MNARGMSERFRSELRGDILSFKRKTTQRKCFSGGDWRVNVICLGEELCRWDGRARFKVLGLPYPKGGFLMFF